jgi:hypothetical protein
VPGHLPAGNNTQVGNPSAFDGRIKIPPKAHAKVLAVVKVADYKASEREQNRYAEVQVRARRRAGEMLAEMEKNKGGRPIKTGCTMQPVSLKEIGIEKTEAYRLQLEAKLPEPEFERHRPKKGSTMEPYLKEVGIKKTEAHGLRAGKVRRVYDCYNVRAKH